MLVKLALLNMAGTKLLAGSELKRFNSTEKYCINI